jgi:hypothetical protein
MNDTCICVDGQRKTTKKPQSGWSVTGPRFERGRPEYEAGVEEMLVQSFYNMRH